MVRLEPHPAYRSPWRQHGPVLAALAAVALAAALLPAGAGTRLLAFLVGLVLVLSAAILLRRRARRP